MMREQILVKLPYFLFVLLFQYLCFINETESFHYSYKYPFKRASFSQEHALHHLQARKESGAGDLAKKVQSSMLDRQEYLLLSSLSFSFGVTSFHQEAAAETPSSGPKKLTFETSSSGLQYADIKVGDGPPVQAGSRINFHYIGRLAGRQGWEFENTRTSGNGDPVRVTLGKDALIQGLEEGLIGMKQGGKRRLVIPSYLGYMDRNVGPIPREFGNRNRLYATVLNKVRTERESKALGTDIAGVVVLDVEVIRVLN